MYGIPLTDKPSCVPSWFLVPTAWNMQLDAAICARRVCLASKRATSDGQSPTYLSLAGACRITSVAAPLWKFERACMCFKSPPGKLLQQVEKFLS